MHLFQLNIGCCSVFVNIISMFLDCKISYFFYRRKVKNVRQLHREQQARQYGVTKSPSPTKTKTKSNTQINIDLLSDWRKYLNAYCCIFYIRGVSIFCEIY